MKSIVFTLSFVVPIMFAVSPSGTVSAADADRQAPPTAEQTRALMKRLLRYVEEHHLKKDDNSEQRGLVYEYFDTRRAGQFDRWVQGEALDTMHDGAWLAAAVVNAYRATGDTIYKDFLVRWQLPFYCKMLNHSDRLFSPKRDDAQPTAHHFNREHLLQEGEKGFVPYWWDDGASVSLERRHDKNPLAPFSCTDRLAGKPNPQFLLDGYSHGSSNHLAQDLGVMLELSWLLLRESTDPADKKLAAEVAKAAKNLHDCRMRHHGHIPMCDAPAALSAGDAVLMKFVPDAGVAAKIDNHYYRALYDFKPGQREAFPGFADEQEYHYYAGLAQNGGKLPRALAFRIIYDAYTAPLLYRSYSDDAEVAAGVNRFDLHPYFAVDGHLLDYRSDRKGPSGKPRPIGSRLGPQNMVCCGWALQALRTYPGIWEERARRDFPKDARVYIDDRVSLLPSPHSGGEGRVRGALDPAPATSVQIYSTKLDLRSTRTALHIEGQVKDEVDTLKLFARPDGRGSYAVVHLDKGEAVNDRGAKVLCRFKREPIDKGFRFALELPYGVVKGQAFWANGVEFGRYSLQIGAEKRNFYLLSPEKQVEARLERELGSGLRTWEAIFNKRGYIPTGIDAGADWEYFSDSGGYAHLLNAAAQWLLVCEGKNDWEQHHVPRVGDAPRLEMRHIPARGENWPEVETANFRVIYHEGRERAEAAARVAESTRRAVLDKWFGEEPTPWKNKCLIFLYPTGDYYARMTGKAANYPGHSTLRMDSNDCERVLERRIDLHVDVKEMLTHVLPHETTHAVLAGRFGRHLPPRWADEGIAVLSEPRSSAERYLKKLPILRSKDELYPLAKLMDLDEYPKDQWVTSFYVQSISLVDFFCKQKGGARMFPPFIRDGLENGYEKALRRCYGIKDFKELEKLWLRVASEQGGLTLDGPGLCDFFRRQTPTSDERKQLQKAIDELGSNQFEVRSKASEDLVRVGIPALFALRRATTSTDLEVRLRALRCIESIRADLELLTTAIHLLPKAELPDDTLAVLLTYLPYAPTIEIEEELLAVLVVLGVDQERARPIVVAALTDKEAARRAAAALIVGRIGDNEQKRRVLALLADEDPEVRLRAAQGLLVAQEKKAVPVLLGLLDSRTSEWAEEADFLLQLAAGRKEPSSSGEQVVRRPDRASWETWWREERERIDLRRIVSTLKERQKSLQRMHADHEKRWRHYQALAAERAISDILVQKVAQLVGDDDRALAKGRWFLQLWGEQPR